MGSQANGGRARRAVIIGSSFAGLTAALRARSELDPIHEVLVLDPRADFTFIPSLIWVPFGGRQPEDITFPLGPMYARKGIRFINQAATAIDVDRRVVTTADGTEISYDALLVATGPRLAFDRVDGLGPDEGHTQSVCRLDHAMGTRAAWDHFLRDPGPVVIGTAQGGSCFGASYEFVLNAEHRIRKAGLSEVAPVTFITAEPFLGHFGLGGVADSQARVEKHFDKLGIDGVPNTAIKEVRDGEIELEGGRTLPFAFSMVIPPFTGVDVVRETEGLGNPMGFVPVDDEFAHPEIDRVYAAGVDVAIAPPEQTPVPAGVPKTGYMSEAMAKVAAANMVADIQGGERKALPLSDMGAMCMLDAGNGGFMIRTDHILGTPEHPRIMSGPQVHWAKVAFEKMFLASRRRGRLVL